MFFDWIVKMFVEIDVFGDYDYDGMVVVEVFDIVFVGVEEFEGFFCIVVE